jgi:hypothetical protein
VERKRCSVEQIVAVLKQAEMGAGGGADPRGGGSPLGRPCIAGKSSTRDWKLIKCGSSSNCRSECTTENERPTLSGNSHSNWYCKRGHFTINPESDLEHF